MAKKMKKMKLSEEDLNLIEYAKYDKVYKEYRQELLPMNLQELRRERFICENKIRERDLYGSNGRLSVVFSLIVLLLNTMVLVLNASKLEKIALVFFGFAVTVFICATHFIVNSFKMQQKCFLESKEYYLKIKVIDEIIEQKQNEE